jgi:SAM-dependent methyltransferase
MGDDIARVWDEKYRERQALPERGPSQFLVENAGLLPEGGRALDVAMGSGRNAVYLASLGFEVTGVEISPVGCEQALEAARETGVRIEAVCADLETWDVPVAAFDAVINFNYLQRDLCPRLAAALKPGGVLVFETFTVEQRQFGWGPKHDAFLLRPGELRELFPELEALVYREETRGTVRGMRAAAGLVALRRA